MNSKFLAIIGVSSALLLGACSDNEKNAEETGPEEMYDLIDESETASEDSTIADVTSDADTLIEEVKEYGKEVAVLLEKAYFFPDDIDEIDEELQRHVQLTSSVNSYMEYLRNTNNYSDPYTVKEIRYNEESERVYKQGEYHYYQVTFEADVQHGTRSLQVDDTFSLRIGQNEDGGFYVQDFIQIDGHTVEGAGPKLTEESLDNFLKETVTNLIKIAKGYEADNYDEAVSLLKEDFTFEIEIGNLLKESDFASGKNRTVTRVVFDEDTMDGAYSTVDSEFVKSTLNGQRPYLYYGTVGVQYKEEGESETLSKIYKYRIYLYQPGYDEGDYEHKFWQAEISEVTKFDWDYFINSIE